MKVVLTCEHAGNEIPQEYQSLFKGECDVLNSHRGYDPGTLDLFDFLKNLSDFSISQNVSRLLVEMNRSLENPELFSEFTSGLKSSVKEKILQQYYFPYRNSTEKIVKEYIQKGEKVLHFSVHSFTPELNGEKRNTDVGLLFYPEREEEKLFCWEFKKHLQKEHSGLIVKFNYPYLGTADGFTTFLRTKFPENYRGIELEVNQKFVQENKMSTEIKKAIRQALVQTLEK